MEQVLGFETCLERKISKYAENSNYKQLDLFGLTVRVPDMSPHKKKEERKIETHKNDLDKHPRDQKKLKHSYNFVQAIRRKKWEWGGGHSARMMTYGPKNP